MMLAIVAQTARNWFHSFAALARPAGIVVAVLACSMEKWMRGNWFCLRYAIAP